ncbi:MAG: hypothetical protein CFE26_05460 [Verrucomicrobiales bacterium VVV1]|nr:MAG: hypothetical protein CFE26_05460 [Verrucomicrobiales bacterium VVV1]
MRDRFHHMLILSLCLAASSCERSDVIGSGAAEKQPKAGAYVMAKLEKIVIPVIEFEDTTIEEAVDFLRMRSFELETGEPEEKGVSWIIKGSSSATEHGIEGSNPVLKINYRAKNVGLLIAVEEIARQAHVDVYLTNVGIVVCRAGDPPLPVGRMEGEEIWEVMHKDIP